MDEDVDKPSKKLARDAARNLLEIAKIKTYPVKLKDIAQHIPDLYIDGKELDESISGMQGTFKGKSFIRYNTAHSDKRNRFTVAHELGHAVLAHTVDCSRSALSTNNPLEVEANQFAAELLVPLEMLNDAIVTITTVDDLARAFWVSKDSMSWRVMETRLFMKLTSWS